MHPVRYFVALGVLILWMGHAHAATVSSNALLNGSQQIAPGDSIYVDCPSGADNDPVAQPIIDQLDAMAAAVCGSISWELVCERVSGLPVARYRCHYIGVYHGTELLGVLKEQPAPPANP